MEKDYKQLMRSLTRSAILSEPCVVLDGLAEGAVRLGSDCGWIEVRGITDYLSKYTTEDCSVVMSEVLTGIARTMAHGSLFVFRLLSDGIQIHLWIGCPLQIMGIVTSSLYANFPGIHLIPPARTEDMNLTAGGVLTGYPSLRKKEGNDDDELAVDRLLRGLGKACYCITVLAQKEDCEQSVAQTTEWIGKEQQVAVSDAERQFSNPNGLSQKIINHEAKAYLQKLEKAEEVFTCARYSASWSVQVCYSADNAFTADHLGGLLCTVLNGDVSSVIEPIVARKMIYIDQAYSRNYLDIINGNVFLLGRFRNYTLNPSPIATKMSSRELARLMTLPRNEYPGYYVDRYVPFDVDVRPGRGSDCDYQLGEIVRTCQKDAPAEGSYSMTLDDLTRHLLIIGLTGGGKTNTSKGLLKHLWVEHEIPFLVIESAKREYWELSALADDKGNPAFGALNVFTLGDENPQTASPFRLNPMEALPGIALQTHIDYLLCAFKAAFELYPPMPYVLETAVYKVYEDRGWDIVTGTNRLGMDCYPMLEDLKDAIEEVTDSLHYDEEVASNVKAALTARIHSLMVGSKDFMMNTSRSIDVEYLLSRPTVLELEDLGDDDTKAFVIGILMVRIYEYRKAMQYRTQNRQGGGKSLCHIIMIEEAHRLLKNVSQGSEGNQSRANAVEFFCNMLAEIRSFGQGFFIADQVPTKLAPDTLKNTNLKIVHRTVMQEDREALGRAMNMTPEQMEYLSALRVGYAAVFGEGDNHPKLVRFPLQESVRPLERSRFIADCRQRIGAECAQAFARSGDTAACRWCPNCCAFSKEADAIIASYGGKGSMLELLDGFGDVSEQSLISLCETVCPQVERNVRLCLAGKVLRWTAVDAAYQTAMINKLVRMMSDGANDKGMMQA